MITITNVIAGDWEHRDTAGDTAARKSNGERNASGQMIRFI